MHGWQPSQNKQKQTRLQTPGTDEQFSLAAFCLQIVDFCLLGILFLAPLFFGGRHPLGRFVFICLAAIAGVAWLVRQTLLGRTSKQPPGWAYVLGFAAILLVTLQLLPLPTPWLQQLAPRNMELLGLGDDASGLGSWKTLSLTPNATKIALATLIAYVLLFITASGRIQELADVERWVRKIALAAILMAGFGILQYLTSNKLFFWFYEYPYTDTAQAAKGSFTCRNHFAHFLVLGFGPLLAWIVFQLGEGRHETARRQSASKFATAAKPIVLYASLVVLVLAVLLSLSRGGAMVLAVASIVTLAVYYRRGFLSGASLYGLGLLGLLVIGMLSLSGYERVATRLDDFTSISLEELDSQAGRRKIWAANVAAIREGSLFGSGAGSHREIYPVYLPQTLNTEYTHAENGYLQIATENGWLGAGLLALAILTISRWCWQALKNAPSSRALVLAGAITASLIASVVHSAFDFVWFIPSCMSLTILLAVCAQRLAQLAARNPSSTQLSAPWARPRWLAGTAVATCAAFWTVQTTLAPAASSLHWDRFLLTSAISKKQTYQQLTAGRINPNATKDQRARTEAMIFHLQNSLARNPQSPRAHLCLAGNYLQQFHERQESSDNTMSVDQIRDAALASQFSSPQALQQWLLRAFGENSRLLYRAHYHAHRALQLCPLQGKAYLYLSNLCFLEGHAKEKIDAYIRQGLQVRPYDGYVLFEAGRQRLLLGQAEQALHHWQQVYRDAGIHQFKIVQLLANQLPAEVFLEAFHPNWQTLHFIWRNYRQYGNEKDWEILLRYAESITPQECAEKSAHFAARIWYSLARIQRDVHQDEAALTSMQKACELSPGDYTLRRELSTQLVQAQRYSQAEPHLRWCLARRPDDVPVRNQLIQVTKSRLEYSSAPSESRYR
ncbi:MAG: O-antigen ligase family protein [Pirellulales bacterium]|nr:O-antigen ligase family protein [Pirellulales bacterium]